MGSRRHFGIVELSTENPFAAPGPRSGRHGGQSSGRLVDRQSHRSHLHSDDSEDDSIIQLPRENPFGPGDESRSRSRIIKPVDQPTESEEEEEWEGEDDFTPPVPRRANLARSRHPALLTNVVGLSRPSARREPEPGQSIGSKASDQEGSNASRREATTLASDDSFPEPNVISPSGRLGAELPSSPSSPARSDEDLDEDLDPTFDEALPSPTNDSFGAHKIPNAKPTESPEVIYVELPRENPFARGNTRRPIQGLTESGSDDDQE